MYLSLWCGKRQQNWPFHYIGAKMEVLAGEKAVLAINTHNSRHHLYDSPYITYL